MLPPELTEIHDRFLLLDRIAHENFPASLRGKLLLRAWLDSGGMAAVLAAGIAGAASLCIDADGDRLRDGLRAGLCDFVVTQMDEALRILKNELRRARPVSVALTGDPEICIDTLLGRGLQPDLISALPDGAARIFVERGAISLPGSASPEPNTGLIEWTATLDPGHSLPRIAALAVASLDPARPDTPARRQWLEQSPRFLGRAFASRQCLRMTAQEIAGFLPQARSEVPSVTITRHGETP